MERRSSTGPEGTGKGLVTTLSAANPTVIPVSPSTASEDTETTEADPGPFTCAPSIRQTSDYEEDAFMFRHVGKRFRNHLKRFGEGFHFQGLFSPRNSPTEGRRLSDPDTVRPEDFQDITRLVWSAFRVPFNALAESSDNYRAIPVILSLIKVPWGAAVGLC